MVIDSDINSIDCFEWQDVYHAIKEARAVRVKNRVPMRVIEGSTGLKITIRFTAHNVMHISWSKK